MKYCPIYYEGCKFLSERRKTCNVCNARNTCITCYNQGLSNNEKDLVMSFEEFAKEPEVELKVPLKKVLDDMNDPNGGMVSIAARDYYCEHYATDEEKEELMRKGDRDFAIRAIIITSILLILFGVFMTIKIC